MRENVVRAGYPWPQGVEREGNMPQAEIENPRRQSLRTSQEGAQGRDRRSHLVDLYSTTSRPFDKPTAGKIAIKVINHYGDEVLKVYDTR